MIIQDEISKNEVSDASVSGINKNIIEHELEKILAGYPMSLDAFNRGLEREERERNKLQER